MKDLIARLIAHLAQMAPHQRQRTQGKLLAEACAALELAREQLILLARLASDKPEFDNPLIVYEVQQLRDQILRDR